MSVYKEGFYALKRIDENSRQLFPDAADFGAPVKKGDSLWNEVKMIAEFYGDKATRRVDRYETGTTCSIEIELMYEGDFRRGQTFRSKIEFVTADLNGFDGYITAMEVK